MGFEPTPFRNGALSHRLRLLGQTVLNTLWQGPGMDLLLGRLPNNWLLAGLAKP